MIPMPGSVLPLRSESLAPLLRQRRSWQERERRLPNEHHYIGERQSGKTTMLIEMSEKTGATIVVATYPMANYIQLLAAQMGKKIPVPITVTNYIRLLASGGLGKSEKYLVDELQMMLSAMNVEAATVDCDCIEVLRGQQKEGL